MARFIKLILQILVVCLSIVIGIYFGWANDENVMVQFFDYSYTLPLFALCYLFMIGGLLVTLFIVAYDYIKMYSQNRNLKRELRYYIRLTQERQMEGSDSGPKEDVSKAPIANDASEDRPQGSPS